MRSIATPYLQFHLPIFTTTTQLIHFISWPNQSFWSMSFFCATYNNFVKVSGALEFQHLTASFSKPAMHEVFIISPRILLKRMIKYIYFLIESHKTLDFFLPHSLSKTSTFQAITLKTITKTYWQFRYLKRQSVAPECMHGVSRVVGWCIT